MAVNPGKFRHSVASYLTNVHRLQSKLYNTNFIEYCSKCKIVGLLEVWSNVTKELVANIFPDFSIHFNFRDYNQRGGVLVMIHVLKEGTKFVNTSYSDCILPSFALTEILY